MAGVDVATVNSRQVALLQVRNAAHRRTNIGNAWNEARFGMFWAVTPSGNNDAAATSETFTPASYLDCVHIGLKDSSVNPPRKAGSQFLGLAFPDRNGLDQIICSTNSAGAGNINTNGSTRNDFASINGATVLSSASSGANLNFPQQASGWSVFLGIRFLVANPGLANQTVQMFYAGLNSNTNRSADLSKAALRNLVMAATYTSVLTATWNAGGVALPLPDYVWVYMPFNTDRFRIANVDAWKIS